MFERKLRLPPPGTRTFFLWGPRQAGKTTLLKAHYGGCRWIDLLKADEFRRYAVNPEFLRQEVEAEDMAEGTQIVIDEIQKVPALLDEVHWLIENRGLHFALCGSSARKVRRGGANLLGGRALRYQLHGLTAAEIGPDVDLDRLLNHAYPESTMPNAPRGCWTPTSRTISRRRSPPRAWSETCPRSPASSTPQR